jgi:hypothetical protein
MPKPETIERCELVVHTTLEQMGFAIAALTRLGIENIQHRLITDELRYKNRRVHEVAANEFAAQFVRQNARFKIAELAAYFKNAGRAASGAYGAAKKLLETRVVAKDGDEYVRVEALPPPKGKVAQTAHSKSGRGQHGPYDVPNRELITRAIKGRKGFTLRELRTLFARHRRPEKSISPILTKMSENKLIKQIGAGEYTVLSKPKPKPKPVKKSVAPTSHVINGSGAAANG